MMSTNFWKRSEAASGRAFSIWIPFAIATRFQNLRDDTQGMNMRFHHCFTDEDAMRWTKLLARKANPGTFEDAILKKSIARLKALKKHRRLGFAKRTAARRARYDAGRS